MWTRCAPSSSVSRTRGIGRYVVYRAHECASASARAYAQRPLTIIAEIHVEAVPVDEPLQRLHEVEVQSEVRGEVLRREASEVCVHVCVDVLERWGSLALVVHGGVEREALVQDLNNLER